MRFQPIKCNMMQLTKKRIEKIQASYTLEGTILENVESIKYLGVTITNDLSWNIHENNICTKANRTLGFLRQNLTPCPKDVKEWFKKDWFALFCSTVVQFGTPRVPFFRTNLRKLKIEQLDFICIRELHL